MLDSLQIKVLDILCHNARTPIEQIAAMLGIPTADAQQILEELERQRVLVGYSALVNWDKVGREQVVAMIEVRVTPQSDMGFDEIASRLYRFDEVRSVYLMSGAYDLLLEVESLTLRDLASFVSQRLAAMDRVLSTSTHFVLKKYKVDGVLMEKTGDDPRLPVTP